jgi:hypothetical protein
MTSDVAGVGDGLTAGLVRHSQRKRGVTVRPDLRSTAPALDPTLGGGSGASHSCYPTEEAEARMADWREEALDHVHYRVWSGDYDPGDVFG